MDFDEYPPLKLFSCTFGDGDLSFPYVPAQIIPPKLEESQWSTKDDSFTHTSTSVNNLNVVDEELIHLKTSDSLWPNLIHYGDPNRSLAPGFDRNTLQVAEQRQTEASPSCVAMAVFAMHSFMRHSRWRSKKIVVNNQDAVRDAVFGFISESTHWAIMQRYTNTAPAEENDTIQLRHQLRWRTNLVTRDQRLINADLGTTRNAGQADGILQIGVAPDPLPEDPNNKKSANNAIVMAKPHWVYSASTLRGVFEGRTLVTPEPDPNNPDRPVQPVFHWFGKTIYVELVRQLWGSMVLMQCRFGIWTNGEQIFVAVRTTDNELVVSPPQPWAQNDTGKAIIGLTFAAIDQSRWEQQNVNILDQLVGQTHLIGRQRQGHAELIPPAA